MPSAGGFEMYNIYQTGISAFSGYSVNSQGAYRFPNQKFIRFFIKSSGAYTKQLA